MPFPLGTVYSDPVELRLVLRNAVEAKASKKHLNRYMSELNAAMRAAFVDLNWTQFTNERSLVYTKFKEFLGLRLSIWGTTQVGIPLAALLLFRLREKH
jgi:hypothetical protein